MTFGKRATFASYLLAKNRVALSIVTNTRYRRLILVHELRNAIMSTIRTGTPSLAGLKMRAIVDGLRLGEKLLRKCIFIDIYRAPIIRIPLRDACCSLC